MKSFLLTVIFLAALNTIAVIWLAVRAELTPIPPAARAIDAIVTAAIGAWAIYLYAAGSAA